MERKYKTRLLKLADFLETLPRGFGWLLGYFIWAAQ